AQEARPRLLAPRRAEHQAADHLPRRAAQSEPRAGARRLRAAGAARRPRRAGKGWSLMAEPATALAAASRAAAEQDQLDDPIDHRAPLLTAGDDYHAITEAVCRPVEWQTPRVWYAYMAVTLAGLALLGIAVGYLFWEGVGIWGNNNPVSWA